MAVTAGGERTPEERQKARDDLLAYAFRALSGRALTETELRTRLLRRTDDETLAAEVLARVQELGYQSDEGVARAEGHRRGWAASASGRPSNAGAWAKG